MEVIREEILEENLDDEVDAVSPRTKRRLMREQRQKLVRERLQKVAAQTLETQPKKVELHKKVRRVPEKDVIRQIQLELDEI